MKLKTYILIIILIGIIPMLKGFDSQTSSLFGYYLSNGSYTSFQVQFFKMLFALGFAIGSIIGGIGVDKWNPKKLLIYSIITISLASVIVQVVDINACIIIHRFILGGILGLLMILLQVYLFEISPTNHRGKFLTIFYLVGIIGGLGYIAFISIFLKGKSLTEIEYIRFQLPSAILPLLVLFVVKYIPNKLYTDNIKYSNLKSVFFTNNKFILTTMIVLTIISVFVNPNMYSYVSTHMLLKSDFNLILALTAYSGAIGSLICVFLIDSVGRRKLFLLGCRLLIILSFINIIAFLFISNTDLIIGFISFYLFSYSLTLGMTTFIIILEYLPNGYRGRGLIIYSIFNWGVNTLNNSYIKLFDLESKYSLSIASIVIFGILITGHFIIRKYLIETKGLTLNEIESKINAPGSP